MGIQAPQRKLVPGPPPVIGVTSGIITASTRAFDPARVRPARPAPSWIRVERENQGERMEDREPDRVTRLLRAWREDREGVSEALMSAVYDHLRRIAENEFSGESSGHTLQPTALVHEAFLQLESADLDFNDRRHFYAIAARTMRRILVDHARARNRAKRGGDRLRVTLSDTSAVGRAPTADLLDLDAAMTELEQHDERVARIVELNYFAGLTREEAAEQLEISVRTLHRDLRMGRAWLRARLT